MQQARSSPTSNQPHTPVLLDAVLGALGDLRGKTVIDGTFGAGGYTNAILRAGVSHVLAIDRDPSVQIFAEQMSGHHGKKLTFIEGQFSAMDEIFRNSGHTQVDAIVLDLGVSSMQLDNAERGFSFMKDGPLDMRMGKEGISASDIVNNWPEKDLRALFKLFGEERKSSLVARKMVQAREKQAITTTGKLSTIIEDVIPRHRPGSHPATRIFQALRIAVNREFDELVSGLIAAEKILPDGGRLVIVSFHSLEDRIVKRFFQDRSRPPRASRHLAAIDGPEPTFQPVRNKPVIANDLELNSNPRARSAKLRIGVRNAAMPRPADERGWGMPQFAYPTPMKQARR